MFNEFIHPIRVYLTSTEIPKQILVVIYGIAIEHSLLPVA